MTKKIIGICLIVIGIALSIPATCIFAIDLTKSKEKMIEDEWDNLRDTGIDSYYSDEMLNDSVEKRVKYGRIYFPIVILVGVAIASGGLSLYRKGRKDEQFSESFQFD